MNILIFAGGSGTRLWPASRKKLLNNYLSLLVTIPYSKIPTKRVRKGVKANQVFIATSSSYASQIRNQLPSVPKTNYSLEPARKNRGPALGLAVLVISEQSEDKIFATAWADDHITQKMFTIKL